MRFPRKSVLAAMMTMMLSGVCLAADEADSSKGQQDGDKPKLTEKEQAFVDQLSGSTLTGSFTVVGQNNDKPPRSESYHIESVTKLRDDYYVFLARAQWGTNDVKIPFTVKVVWADDTPMIQLTNVTFPGVGTFSTRVLFDGDRYAGTWQHGKVGGHMFGTISKTKKEDSDEKPADN